MAQSSGLLAADLPADPCRFVGLHRFDDFTAASTAAGQQVLISPIIKAPLDWNELIISWNSSAPANSWLKLEARGIYPNRQTKYYTLALWSLTEAEHPRQSVREQGDTDGDVKTDTLILRQPGADLQLRVTLAAAGTNAPPELRFIGLSFLDNRVDPVPAASDRRAWGKIIPTPECSQFGYPGEQGWCSAASVAMVLERWSAVLGRPEMNLDVPPVASNVYDEAYGGTGNWVFNTAFAGSFPGMRACVTRLRDLTEVESWISAGIPVILSAKWNLLSPGRKDTGAGHLVVCVGFAENGDVVINDPATHVEKGQSVRHVYARENVIAAWKTSRNTVYLIYPETAISPASPQRHWDNP